MVTYENRRGTGRRTVTAAAATVVLVWSACACSGDDGSIPLPATTASEPVTTTTTTTTTVPVGVDEATAKQVWIDAWTVASAADATVQDLAEITSPDVAERLIRVLHLGGDVATAQALPDVLADDISPDEAERLIESLQRGVERVVTNTPYVSPGDGDGLDSVRMDDCLLISPPAVMTSANWYRGVVTLDETAAAGLRVTVLEPEVYTGCVPASVAEAALAGYQDSFDATDDYWVPADPDSPRIAETTTGARFDLIAGLVAEHAAAGWELRDRPETHPELYRYNSPTEVVIFDCQRTDPERGFYVTATGERLPEIPPIVDGRRDVLEVTMKLVDGRWKNAYQAAARIVECEFAPTERGIPVVGGEQG